MMDKSIIHNLSDVFFWLSYIPNKLTKYPNKNLCENNENVFFCEKTIVFLKNKKSPVAQFNFLFLVKK